MNIQIVGGGPGGLYTAILLKKLRPSANIHVYERNRPDDTFGWGVVFSDETMEHFRDADEPTYNAITKEFRHWDKVVTHVNGEVVETTGHGYSAMGRLKLLQIFQERATALGIHIQYETDISSLSEIDSNADLIVAADGINSNLRNEFADHFQPEIDIGTSKFTWLGTTLPLENFTFVFKQHEHGMFQAHAYPFDDKTSTFIVETTEEAWHRCGLEGADEATTLAFCEQLFADELNGHKLLSNKSQWINFRRVRNATWFRDRMILIGDAAHTAHFSIGSGTKLAMEDAIALTKAIGETTDVPTALKAYQEARWVDVAKLQKTAETSRRWFEEVEMMKGVSPTELVFSLLTRSKRITHNNLRERDPEYIQGINRWFADRAGVDAQTPPPPMFTPFSLRDMTLKNRVVVSSMCQYQAKDGVPNDWHLMHLGARAVGGAGLVMTEMTDVTPEGRISKGCCGLWNDEQQDAWKRIVDFVHHHSQARIGIQLAHAGRKGSCTLPWEGGDPLTEDSWQTLAPSAVGYNETDPLPKEMDRKDMDRIRDAFVSSANRAKEAGFDLVELHMAHGYLLSSFLSPLTNLRTDEYGGSIENRLRYPLEIFDAVRSVWPKEKPMSVRISASDWCKGGMDIKQSVQIARALQEHSCDIIDVSSGGNVTQSAPVYGRMFQTPFAHRIRREVGIPTMAVGAILGWDHVNTIVASGRADLCALARPHLADPHLTLHAAAEQGYEEQAWPNSYLAAKPRG